MKTICMFILSFMFFLSGCCEDSSLNTYGDEKVLTIKHMIERDAPGYSITELIIDTTTIRYVKKGHPYLPDFDSSFTISIAEWNKFTNSFNMDIVMTLDSSYPEGTIEGYVNLEIITNKRSKKIHFNEAVKVAPIDSLNKLLYTFRE